MIDAKHLPELNAIKALSFFDVEEIYYNDKMSSDEKIDAIGLVMKTFRERMDLMINSVMIK